MPIALTCLTSAVVGPKASRSRMWRIWRSETRSAAPAFEASAVTRSRNRIPANAGIHRDAARAAAEWVPAFAGTGLEPRSVLVIRKEHTRCVLVLHAGFRRHPRV